jgi:DNA repair protein SbcD/Mre11
MRFIHTADWHLGRLFHGVHLTDDQEYLLERFVELVDDVRPAAVLVAGDVYDRGVPPPQAVELLDHVLQQIVLRLGVPVVMIAGNHDSAGRLGFASRLLEPQGLYIAGPVSADPLAVPFAGADGEPPVVVHAVPYADPVLTRDALGDEGEDIHDHQAALTALCARARGAAVPKGARRLLLAHAFVAGALTSDSERPLTVGGAGAVAADTLAGFDYVALGHLHRPQPAGSESARYAGSLLKYSFSEALHDKSVTIVELGSGPPAAPVVEQVSLAPRRDVRIVEGTLREVVDAARADARADDYVCARLLDKGALLDAIGQLRDVYPNVLTIERPELAAEAARCEPARPGARSEAEHFAAFFEYVCDEPLTEAERQAFAAVADRLEREARES